MTSHQFTARRTLFAAILTVSVACAAPENGGDGAAAEAEPTMEVIEVPPQPMADPADVASVDAIITAVYEVISGEAGEARDWDRFRSLFAPDARLIPVATETSQNGRRSVANAISPEQFVQGADDAFVSEGFYEVEIGGVTEMYGDIAHRFSSYASFRAADETEPFNRGINSFQLLNDGERWWILTIFWQHEPDAGPIPDRYLEPVRPVPPIIRNNP
ncbi:MAG: hypothetical protein OXE96_05275 [Gemmatimonadetes bacterium]|nr:hypothetical protein [Gemmatimonadota bacterium]